MEPILLLPEHDKLLELVSEFLSVAQEIMVQQLVCIGSLLRVFIQTSANEALENGGPLRVLQLGCVLSHDEVQHFLLRLADIGRLTISQLKCKDTE